MSPLTLYTLTIHYWFSCTKHCLIAHHYQLIVVGVGRCTRTPPAWGTLWGWFCVKRSIYQNQARQLTCFCRLVQLIWEQLHKYAWLLDHHRKTSTTEGGFPPKHECNFSLHGLACVKKLCTKTNRLGRDRCRAQNQTLRCVWKSWSISWMHIDPYCL